MFNLLKPDIAVTGEGEKTILELLKCIKNKGNLKSVRGIMFKQNKKIIFTEPSELEIELGSIPYPDFKGLNLSWEVREGIKSHLR